jgi:hypothetical protein
MIGFLALCSPLSRVSFIDAAADNYQNNRNHYLSTNHAHHINDWKDNFNPRRDYNTNGWRRHNNCHSAHRDSHIIRSRSNWVIFEQG